ncbi:MAG: hypothetical protein ACQETD_06565 [Pseudomonadota bacterium]
MGISCSLRSSTHWARFCGVWGMVGCWLLVAGCWLLVAGCWLLVAGCWLCSTPPQRLLGNG